MKFWVRTICILLGLLAASAAATADSVVFPAEIPDFQDAVSSMSPGDSVLVEPGDWSAGYTFMPSGITVASLNGDPATTTLGGHLHVIDREGIVVRGIGFRGGPYMTSVTCVSSEVLFEDARMTGSEYIALYCEDSDITFRSALLSNNLQAVRAEGSRVSFEEVTFTGNGRERNGAGFYALGSHVTITGCVFRDNETGNFDYSNTWWAYVGTGGGACLKEGSTLVASDVLFDSNHTWRSGGGLALLGASTHASISNCSFINNTTSTHVSSEGELQKGAALYVDDATVTLDGVVFSGNWCNRDGGALYCNGGAGAASVTATSCVFADNTAVQQGGAFYGPVEVGNCTFVDNAANYGSAMYASPSQTIHNSIVCCTPGGVSTAGVFFSRCCLWSSATDGEASGRSNMNVDPLFCDYQSRDLTLCEDSPCLPENNDWGELVGALGAGCEPCNTVVQRASWGAIKALYRERE
jgi:predicted outer membrane repeat protein